MKRIQKILVLFVFIVMSFSLSACDFSFNGNKGEIVNQLTQLSAPTLNEDINDNLVRWSSVSNADAYVISMNGVEARTTDLSYPISGLIFESCEVSIKVMAKGNGILYSDSEWSKVIVYDYTKKTSSNDGDNSGEKTQVGFSDKYSDIGLGRPVNMITGPGSNSSCAFSPANGAALTIFDQTKLYQRLVLEQSINLGKGTYQSGSSYESFANDWNIHASAKVSKESLMIDGFHLPGQTNFNINIGGGYERKSKSETTELYFKFQQNITGKKLELLAYSDVDYYGSILSQEFKDAAGKVQNGQMTPEQFVRRFGTHVMMAAYYGAAIEANYYTIKHSSNVDQNWNVNAAMNLKTYLLFSDVNVDVNLDYAQYLANNNSSEYAYFDATAIGGNASLLNGASLQSFATSRDAWANSVNESNWVLIDVPEESLYCVWDYLDNSYAEAKRILREYFVNSTNALHNEYESKYAQYISNDNPQIPDNPVEEFTWENKATMSTLQFTADLYCESKKMNTLTFDVIGQLVAYQGKEYIYGNASFIGGVNGTRFNDVETIYLKNVNKNILFGGALLWSGSESDNNESGMAMHNVTSTGNSITYYVEDPGKDFAGNETNRIFISGLIIETGNALSNDKVYPELARTTFSATLRTEGTDQDYVTFDVLGIKTIIDNDACILGFAWLDKRINGSRFNDVASIKLINPSKTIVSGGFIYWRGSSNDNNETGMATCVERSGNDCIYWSEDPGKDFAGNENNTIVINGICLKTGEVLTSVPNTSFIPRIETANMTSSITPENQYRGRIDLTITGFVTMNNGIECLVGQFNYLGKVGGNRFNDVAYFVFSSTNKKILSGGVMSWYGSYSDNNESGMAAQSQITDGGHSIKYTAEDPGKDFAFNETTYIVLSWVIIEK